MTNETNIVSITKDGMYIKKTKKEYFNKDYFEHGTRFFEAKENDTLVLFTDKQATCTIKVSEIPEGSRNAKGRNVSDVFNLDADEKLLY